MSDGATYCLRVIVKVNQRVSLILIANNYQAEMLGESLIVTL